MSIIGLGEISSTIVTGDETWKHGFLSLILRQKQELDEGLDEEGF